MAIKPTIYKLRISLSDMDRDYYDTLNLTLALHPSETLERMMARVMAYCINAQQDLVFTKGLSDVDEPDIWLRTLDEQIALWIEVGEPSVERVKKACQRAKAVRIYCFNNKADLWWQQSQRKITQYCASVYHFEYESIQSLAKLVQRTMDISVSISGNTAYIATEAGECELDWHALQDR